MTTSQIIASAIAWAALAVALIAVLIARRTRPGIPYTPPPREHCGELKPTFFESDQHAECVLRPGHSGSHADNRGARWWLTHAAANDGTVCEAYRLPATAEDSGLCAGCGMSDYKHEERP